MTVDATESEAEGSSAPSFIEKAPMAFDRTPGWDYFRAGGEVYDADGKWYLTSADAVRFGTRNPEIFSSARAFDAISALITLVPLAVDPPEHTRYRRVLDPMLSPKVMARLEDDLRKQVGGLIDGFASEGSCDVMADLARTYPTQAILTLFGLPQDDLQQFLVWVDTLIGGSVVDGIEAATPEQIQAAGELLGYLHEKLEYKRAHLGDDMLSSILALDGDEVWSEQEILGLCFLIVLAGLDTVTAEIGFVFHYLATNPELRARVVSDPSLVPPLIEEVLRLELPAPLLPRVTTQEVEVCGVTIPKGARCFLVLATANREESRGGDPNAVDVDTAARSHLSFGGGMHRCLGSHLARRELRLTIEEFHKRIPEYSLAEGATPRVAWPSGTLHLEEVPLTFPTR
jgi:cytochrome P450